MSPEHATFTTGRGTGTELRATIRSAGADADARRPDPDGWRRWWRNGEGVERGSGAARGGGARDQLRDPGTGGSDWAGGPSRGTRNEWDQRNQWARGADRTCRTGRGHGTDGARWTNGT